MNNHEHSRQLCPFVIRDLSIADQSLSCARHVLKCAESVNTRGIINISALYEIISRPVVDYYMVRIITNVQIKHHTSIGRSTNT